MKSYWSREVSDEELVERTRKNLNRTQKFRWLFLLYAVVFFGIAIWFAPAAYEWIEKEAQRLSGNQWMPFLVGMSFGMSIGTLYLLLLLKSVAWFILFVNPFIWTRRDRLLVEYHDALHKAS
jgi:TRAP-type C4-dicarboxylate transport system permease small subunit